MGTLFLNDAEIREIREKIDTYPWARDLHELVKGNAARKRLVEDWPHPHWFWSFERQAGQAPGRATSGESGDLRAHLGWPR